MSPVVRPTDPIKRIPPPRHYPAWLKATFADANVAVPESVLEENRSKIEYTQVIASGRVLGGEPNPRANYMPPPMVVEQRPKVLVTFKVLTIEDRPITGFNIRVDSQNLITDAEGQAWVEVYEGIPFSWSTGRESGWSLPIGAKRRLRMTGLVPMSQTFPVSVPIMLFVYPESGEFQIGKRVFTQTITYTTS